MVLDRCRVQFTDFSYLSIVQLVDPELLHKLQKIRGDFSVPKVFSCLVLENTGISCAGHFLSHESVII